ncbi:hypothetical protein, partial [Pseudomonas fluorescens]|uniref:hypothetical protein n=1 Tax=Pseudomonas fluorescens TaxID=294 RepID=UPI001E35534A
AREKLTGAAFIQKARVIVEVFREQARAYSGIDANTLVVQAHRVDAIAGKPAPTWVRRASVGSMPAVRPLSRASRFHRKLPSPQVS